MRIQAWRRKCESLSCVQLCVTPWTVPTRLLCPWNSPGENTRLDSHSLLQVIFPTQGSNPCLLHGCQILYRLNHQGNNVHNPRKHAIYSPGPKNWWRIKIERLPFWWGTISIESGKKKKKNEQVLEFKKRKYILLWGSQPPHWAPTVQSPWGAGIWDSDGEELSALVPELRLPKLSAVHWVIY